MNCLHLEEKLRAAGWRYDQGGRDPYGAPHFYIAQQNTNVDPEEVVAVFEERIDFLHSLGVAPIFLRLHEYDSETAAGMGTVTNRPYWEFWRLSAKSGDPSDYPLRQLKLNNDSMLEHHGWVDPIGKSIWHPAVPPIANPLYRYRILRKANREVAMLVRQ